MIGAVLGGLAVILVCQLVGEAVVRVSGIPLPGPVLGMVLFLVVLRLRRPSESDGTVRAADGLLRHLALFFVPAGVGVITHLDTVRDQWLPITGGLVLSWLVALLVTGGVATLLRRPGAAERGTGR